MIIKIEELPLTSIKLIQKRNLKILCSYKRARYFKINNKQIGKMGALEYQPNQQINYLNKNEQEIFLINSQSTIF